MPMISSNTNHSIVIVILTSLWRQQPDWWLHFTVITGAGLTDKDAYIRVVLKLSKQEREKLALWRRLGVMNGLREALLNKAHELKTQEPQSMSAHYFQELSGQDGGDVNMHSFVRSSCCMCVTRFKLVVQLGQLGFELHPEVVDFTFFSACLLVFLGLLFQLRNYPKQQKYVVYTDPEFLTTYIEPESEKEEEELKPPEMKRSTSLPSQNLAKRASR
eukprot:g5863.t1